MAVKSPGNQLLKQSEWEALFPKSAQNEQGFKFVAEHSLKFAIALDKPLAGVLSMIEALKKIKSPQFNSLATQHQLSVLIIAVMKDKKELIFPLLEAGAKIEVADAYGWRALHHAALVSDEIFDLLVRRGADSDASTRLNASPLDISILTGRQEPTGLEERLYFRAPAGEIEPVDAKGIEQRTGLKQYRQEPLYPADRWQELWRAEPVPNNTDYRVPQLLRTYYRSPPKLILGPSGIPASSDRLLGVFAGENLKKFAVVAKYAGELTIDSPGLSFIQMFERERTEGIYRFEDLDGANVGNISRFFNDGFPNLMAIAQHNSRGRQKQMIFVAMKEIVNGEELTWDYGSLYRSLKWGKYSIINKEAMQQYFRSNSMAHLVTALNQDVSFDVSRNKFLECFLVPMFIYYVFNTPAALIDLTLAKIVKVDDWFLIKKYKFFKANIVDRDSHHFHINTGVVHLLKNFNQALGHVDSRIADDICSFFLQQEGQLTVFQIIKGIDEMTQWLQMTAPKASWEEKKKELQANLPGYNWIHDKKFILYPRINQNLSHIKVENML